MEFTAAYLWFNPPPCDCKGGGEVKKACDHKKKTNCMNGRFWSEVKWVTKIVTKKIQIYNDFLPKFNTEKLHLKLVYSECRELLGEREGSCFPFYSPAGATYFKSHWKHCSSIESFISPSYEQSGKRSCTQSGLLWPRKNQTFCVETF